MADEKEEKIADEVLVDGAAVVQKSNDRAGIIRYRGPITGEKGVWFGIECLAGNDKKGGSNGVKAKKRYFFAPQGRALFCQASDIKKVLSKASKAASGSNSHNIVDPADRIEARAPADWTANDVGRWLQKIGALECITIFLVHNVTGSTLIKLADKDLEKQFSIKDKDTRKLIIDERKRLLQREPNALPNLDEGAELKTSLDEEAEPSDTILAPPLTNLGGEGWRSRSKSSPLVKKSPRKRDSYSVPENLRGQLPNPFGRRHQNNRNSKPAFVRPERGSFRDLKKGLLPPPVSRFHSTPVAGVASDRQQLLADREQEEYLNSGGLDQLGSSPMLQSLSEQDGPDKDDKFVAVGAMNENGADSEKGHKRSSSLTDFIESNPMKKWPTEICAKWINSLGGKTSTYGSLFRDKKVTGEQVFHVTNEALTALGVKEPGVRKWILTQRDTLLKKAAASS